MTGDYGKRECMTCGKVFVALRPSQICCSRECQRKRGKALTSQWKANHSPNCKEADWLNARYEDLLAEYRRGREEIVSLRQALAAAPKVEPPKREVNMREVKGQSAAMACCANCGKYFKSRQPAERFCSEACEEEHRLGSVAL